MKGIGAVPYVGPNPNTSPNPNPYLTRPFLLSGTAEGSIVCIRWRQCAPIVKVRWAHRIVPPNGDSISSLFFLGQPTPGRRARMAQSYSPGYANVHLQLIPGCLGAHAVCAANSISCRPVEFTASMCVTKPNVVKIARTVAEIR